MSARRFGLALTLLLCVSIVQAQVRSSANYAITVDEVNSGGGMSSSANYLLRGTIGQPISSMPMTSANYANNGGLQPATPSPYLDVSTLTLGFGSVPVGIATSPQSVTLTNRGNVLLNLSGLLTGANPEDFGQGGCASSLAVGANCVTSVIFTPQAVGARSATLQFTANAPGSPINVGLGGIGTAGTTTLGLVASVNPSRFSQSVTFTATIGGGVSPTGTVQFKDGASNLGSPVAISGGQAQFTTAALLPGPHSIGAAYSGDAGNGASNASTLSQRVRAVRNDLDGNGKSDIFWMHSSSQTYVWQMNGAAIAGSGSPTSTGDANWQVKGFGDFDGDGKADVLFRHAISGATFVWLMNGTTIAGSGSPGTIADAGWQVQGVGDFDGDGKADVLWMHTDGTVLVWFMNGTSISSTGSPANLGPASGWAVQGVGDFDGDGKADILWQHSSGLVLVWLMNGSTIASSGSPANVGGPGAGWVVKGVGDFNGDGKADILWRNDVLGGIIYVWLMNGTALSSAANVTGVGTEAGQGWIVKSVGDYDGDGKADVFWKNDILPGNQGITYVWLMNGAAISTATSVTGVADTNWQVQNPK